MAGVTAKISKKTLEFTPNNPLETLESGSNGENLLDVIVVNDSDKFASFQLELSALGVNENSYIKWYSVEPEVCAKTPPGSETKFQIAIIKAPIPAYDTNIDLELDIFSVEYEKLKTKKKLKLKINRPLKSLQVKMPVKIFSVRPGDSISIPLLVYNLSPKFSEITLTCSQLNPEWMTATQEILQLESGDSQNITFSCQPPIDTLSKEYNFAIEVQSNTSQYTTREQGILEVVADGVVEFSCTDKKKIIPTQESNNYRKATYELVFWNDSNLSQHVDIISPEKDQIECGLIISEGINIAPKETKVMHLFAAAKRHWLGRKKIRNFAVSAVLSNPVSREFSMEIFPKPNTEVLELEILPIIPFLIQLGGAILIPLLLFLSWWMRPQVYHQGSVNSVRFFGNGSLVFSGSSDQTIRRWQVEDNPRILKSAELEDKGKVAKKEDLRKAIRVIRQSPKDNDLLAVGLENGEIKLWDISLNKNKNISFPYNNVNRVFDLVFSQDGRYLFSGHANSIVNQWKLESDNEASVTNSVKVNFAVYALAIDENIPNNPLIIIAGRYNKIAVWQPQNNRVYELTNNYNQWRKNINKTDKINTFDPVIGQQDYITSLVNTNNILASADNQGYITLWDINKIRQCISNDVEENVKKVQTQNNLKPDQADKVKKTILTKTLSCSQDIITNKWRNGHGKQPVRSVALTQNSCYLASAGDDGRVMLWSVSKSKQKENGETIFNFADTKFNTVDIKALKDNNGDYILITSGDDNYQVRIERKGIDNNGC
ncbi:MAG: hypothetical protein HC836_20495 [Richelia sp. RM2_1_2]|nr:hypothetical protein [Richelia sp. SM1_7_0]NJN10660.1 hypothetical protein [Richelia sp. RM1_1_1]NJO60554.1 hypothetical protein [Richelia sp. RM2_1_2]